MTTKMLPRICFEAPSSATSFSQELARKLLCPQNGSDILYVDDFTPHPVPVEHDADVHDYLQNVHAATNNYGERFYAYVTPFLILIGLFGNVTSLCVFFAKRMRKLNVPLYYLTALSASDTIVLMSYVLMEWLNKGLPLWQGKHRLAVIDTQGMCHVFLLLSYTFRFVSVYLIVAFTVERYSAICNPFENRACSRKSTTRKVIAVVLLIGSCISIPKLALSGLYSRHNTSTSNVNCVIRQIVDDDDTSQYLYFNETDDVDVLASTEMTSQRSNSDNYDCPRSERMCQCSEDYANTCYAIDVSYGFLITAVPYILMLGFNIPVIRQVIRTYGRKNHVKLGAHHGVRLPKRKLTWELTVTQLVVSSCFVFLNLPFFVTWCQLIAARRATPGAFGRITSLRNQLAITKTVFYVNYCINFFLYCLTGSYYRGVLRDWLAKFGCCFQHHRKHQCVTSHAGRCRRYDSIHEKISRSVSMTATTAI